MGSKATWAAAVAYDYCQHLHHAHLDLVIIETLSQIVSKPVRLIKLIEEACTIPSNGYSIY